MQHTRLTRALFSPLQGWQVGNPWCFYQVRFPMNLRQARPTWSSASRWLWPGGRRGCVAGSLVWPRRCGSRCASVCWSVAISSGMSAGTAVWTAGEASWREVSPKLQHDLQFKHKAAIAVYFIFIYLYLGLLKVRQVQSCPLFKISITLMDRICFWTARWGAEPHLLACN